jgi:hypothetical protein
MVVVTFWSEYRLSGCFPDTKRVSNILWDVEISNSWQNGRMTRASERSLTPQVYSKLRVENGVGSVEWGEKGVEEKL